MKTKVCKTASSSSIQLRFGGAWQRISLALLLLVLTTMTAWADDSWTSGDCTVTLTGSTLTVSKTVPSSTTGAMANYSSSDQQPWKDFKYEIESLVIKKGVTSIGNYAFAQCACLESVRYEAESQLTAIGDYAFSSCYLASAYIPASVTSIGDDAFAYCGNLKNVFVCPETPPTLGENVFVDCGYNAKFTVRSNSYTTATGWNELSNVTVGDANGFNKPYIDADGNDAICPYAIPITSGFSWDTNGDLWFYISGTDEVEPSLSFSQDEFGTINLIICDDAERTIKYLNSNKTLNIYGQKNNTGKLTTNDSDYNGCGIHAEFGLSIYGGNYEISNASNGIACSGHLTISGSNITLTGATDNGISTSDGNITIIDSKINITGGGISASDGDYNVGGSITINGSEITINGGQFSSTGGDILINDGTITVDGYNGFVSTGNVTINGGEISITAGDYYSYGISAGGSVTINGGEITASATGSGSYGIAGTTITLGDATIKASSYDIYGSIKIADGLTLSDGNDAYSGTLYDGTDNGKFEDLDALNAALANKTLKKLPAFIDLTATIVWNDNNNQSDKRPASVTVSLKGNGTQIATCELTESGEWKYTVEKPSLSNGTLIVYTWDVPNMPNGYGLTDNSADGTTTTLTLTLQQCGENVAWNYDASSKTLTISGTGAMDDYSSTDVKPWSSFSNDIESLVINKDVTSIGSYAFTGCTNLKSVTCEAGSTLEIIGASAFAGCSSLTSINIPAGVTSIGASAFADCTALGSVTYAAGTQLETIGENAFASCSSLASIIIPVGVTSIGASAFEGCTSLTSVTAYPQTPPTLGEDAFKEINGNVAFTVRNDSYKTADGWSAWASKMTILDPSQFIPYIDANGNEAFCTNATQITSDYTSYGGTDEEDDLWYYVDGTVDFSDYIQFQDFSGSTNIILCDGASLKVKYLEANNAINIYRQGGDTPGKITTTGYNNGGYGLYSGYGGLSIYGGTINISGSTDGIFSSGGNITIADCNITISDKGGFIAWANYFGGGDIIINSGNITITDGDIYASKGDDDSGKGGNITINGGEITVDGGKFWSFGGDILINGGTITVEGYSGFESDGDVTINGGKITATPTGSSSYGINAGGSVTINGGEITATATGSGSYGIAGNTITLGDATITASSYNIYGSIKIADGFTLSDGTDAYSGTLYDGTDNGKFIDLETLNAALANKTLKKLPAFIDLTATIVWNDNNNQSDKRPASVTVSLKGNGTQIATCELTESGEWKYTVEKPSLSNGTLIVYTWDVPNMPNGYGLTDNSADGTTTTLTLTLQQCGENVAWNYDASSKTLTISGTGAMDDYSSTDVKPWSSFSNDIESLVINKDVTSIGSYAFTGCTNLKSVTCEAGSTLEIIGASAFAGCSSLTSINIPAGVTSIGASAFADCTALGSVTYAAGTQLETIGENAFASCSSLASIIIPVGVTSIGASAFEGCTSLTSVTAYPQTPPTLGEDAFKEINGNVAFTVRNDSYKTADGWSAWASKMTILDPSQFIPYIDANGNEAFCTNATQITSDYTSYGGTDEEDDLWYYVDGTVDFSDYIQFQDFSGSTNIILCDGASLKVKYLEANNAINIYRQGGDTPGKITTTGYNNGGYGLYSGYGGLSIYGGTINISGSTDGIFSSGGNITIADCNITISDKGGFIAWANYFGGGDIIINSGNITITDGDIYASKGDDDSGKGGNITINGGEITVDGGKFWSFGGDILINGGTITVEGYSGFESDGDVTINGGKITATPTGSSSYGINAGGSVTINGGEITATATGSGSCGIFAGSDITLGDAIIKASSYQVSGSFKITDGLFMSEGTKAYSGTLFDGSVYPSIGKFEDLDALNTALAGKTLQKLPDYIDLTARIVWDDYNNQYSKRPTSVTVSLMANGVKVEGATNELNKTREWNCTVPNQPSLNEGELIEYTWEVNDVSGWYELSESAEATTTTLTFTIQQCGQQGSDVIWGYDPDSKTITISGTGLMMYYNSIQNENVWSNGAPWKDFADEIEAVVVENGITYVGSNTFAHCPNISNVTLPTDGIYEIGPGAFADCTSLTSIDIPMSINTIGKQAFAGCSHLETVSIGYGEAASFTIGSEVFPVTAVIIVPETSLSGYQTATGWSTYQIVPATRTFFAAGTTNLWMTWCDKNAYTKPEGVTVYTVSDVDDNTVTLAEVSDVIPAYTPVLLYRSTAGSDAVKAAFNAVGTEPEGYNGIVETVSGNAIFLGNPGDEPYASGNNNNIYAIGNPDGIQSYVLRNGNFVAVDEDGGIGAHRCWLNVTKSTTNNAPMLRISLGDATAIENCQQSTVHTQLNEWYGIDGRKLDKQPTTKGLYINNGKKYIIK